MAARATRPRPKRLISVVGARPQFIKAARLAQAFEALPQRLRPHHDLIHTGQHYDVEMSEWFFRDLTLPRPTHHLGLGGLPPAIQCGRMVDALTRIFERQAPEIVIVYGDTTSTLAGALAAAMLKVPVAHVEAGLRSFNRAMPEEQNRVVTDRLAQWLLCPTQTAVRNLRAEGITQGIALVGDVMIDALIALGGTLAERQVEVLARWRLSAREYYLATVHRAENTDDLRKLTGLFDTLARLDRPTILPLHPRTRARLRRAGWAPPRRTTLRLVSPIPYNDMLSLERAARVILTDSGGMQKEAYWFGVPCLTLREETEWVETLRGGWNHVVGTNRKTIMQTLRSSRIPAEQLDGLVGDGHAAERIARILLTGDGSSLKGQAFECEPLASSKRE